jgi:hypothetical protein
MKNQNFLRDRYVSIILVASNEYKIDELNEMSLVELRDLVDDLKPTQIISVTATARGGKSIKQIRLSKPA